MRERNYSDAFDKLGRLCAKYPDRPEFNLLLAHCGYKLGEFGVVDEVLGGIDCKIKKSKVNKHRKRYLTLYAEYLGCFLLDDEGKKEMLAKIRDEAGSLKSLVPGWYLRDFPMERAGE